MNSVTREFIWGLVLFILGFILVINDLDYFILETTLYYLITSSVLRLIGICFIIFAVKVLARNLENKK